MPIEIKSGRTLTNESVAGLEKWRALAGAQAVTPALIYAGDDSYKQKDIKVLAWKESGKLLK